MDLIMRRETLRMDLDLLSALAPTKTTSTPSLTCILMECDAETGALTCSAADGENMLTCNPNAGEVNESGAIMVNAKQFADTIRAMTGDTISITTERANESTSRPGRMEYEADPEGKWLRLESGKSVFHLHSMPVEQFPFVPQTPPTQATMKALALEDMIKRIAFVIQQKDLTTSNVSIPAGALLEIRKNGAASIMATDGTRFVQAKHWTEKDVQPVAASPLIPREGLELIAKIAAMGGDVQIAVGANHIFFTFGKRYLVIRQMAAKFPNVAPIFDKVGRGKTVVAFNASAMSGMLKLGMLAVSGDKMSKAVNLDFNPAGTAELNAVHSLFGEAQDEIPVTMQGPDGVTLAPITVRLNAEYLLSFLSNTSAERLSMILTDAISPFLIRGRGEGWEHIFILVPINPALVQAPIAEPPPKEVKVTVAKRGGKKAKDQAPSPEAEPTYVEQEAPF